MKFAPDDDGAARALGPGAGLPSIDQTNQREVPRGEAC